MLNSQKNIKILESDYTSYEHMHWVPLQSNPKIVKYGK